MRIPVFVLFILTLNASADLQWIWSGADAGGTEKVTFTKTFAAEKEVRRAMLMVSCDNTSQVFVNGEEVLKTTEWQSPGRADVAKLIKKGPNELKIIGANEGGPAGLLARLSIQWVGDEERLTIETDDTWETPAGKAVVVGKYGDGPWGEVFARNGRGGGRPSAPQAATPVSDITVPEGFAVELLYTVPRDVQGSWVSMAFDPKGRLLVSDQNGILYRLTLDQSANGQVQIEPISIVAEGQSEPVGGAHGLLYAFESLYVVVDDGRCTHGLYRLRDTNNDDQFDQATLLRELKGGGEHGPHSVILSPDGQSLYIACGNHTDPPNLEESRPARAWDEDHLLPRMWDANGHAQGRMAPGGFILKTDPDGKTMELFCSGFRNEFGIAFNQSGDLFTFDADMEWDIGTPWYRPTRLNHCTSGAEFGWRSGSGKWPVYYPDSLPAINDVGPGSPTAVCSGMGAKFPAKYQRAIYLNDWTYGTMYALHLEPSGASYKTQREEFVFGRPLPLTGVTVSPYDGAMYFMIGGRGTQSALYRVTYVGAESTESAPSLTKTAEAQLRASLERLHLQGTGVNAIDEAWPYLDHPDRFVRFAARVAVERQPVALWADRAIAESRPWGAIEAAVALARMSKDEASRQAALLGALKRSLDQWATLPLDKRLGLLRAYGLAFTRMGEPSAEVKTALLDQLDSLYPTAQTDLDRELCDLLVYLGSPSVVAKTVQLMGTANDAQEEIATDDLLSRNQGYASAARAMHATRPNRQQIAFAFSLRNAKNGWTPELRHSFFQWFPRARQFQGGNSFAKFIDNIRTEALANVATEAERGALDELSSQDLAPATDEAIPGPKGPGRSWTVESAVAALDGQMKGRDFKNGHNLFRALACAACHRFNGEGGGIGPDVTGAGNRYSLRDLMENIVNPSKVISDQYGSHQITKKDGSVIIGRVMVEENGKTFVALNPFSPGETLAIDAEDIAEKKDYPVSMMPAGLINALNPDELRDLTAYLLSAGNAEDGMFK